MAAAEAVARRVLAGGAAEAGDRVDRLYGLLLNAPPDAEERTELLRFIREMEARLSGQVPAEAEARAWSMACQALLASSRFQILE